MLSSSSGSFLASLILAVFTQVRRVPGLVGVLPNWSAAGARVEADAPSVAHLPRQAALGVGVLALSVVATGEPATAAPAPPGWVGSATVPMTATAVCRLGCGPQ